MDATELESCKQIKNKYLLYLIRIKSLVALILGFENLMMSCANTLYGSTSTGIDNSGVGREVVSRITPVAYCYRNWD